MFNFKWAQEFNNLYVVKKSNVELQNHAGHSNLVFYAQFYAQSIRKIQATVLP